MRLALPLVEEATGGANIYKFMDEYDSYCFWEGKVYPMGASFGGLEQGEHLRRFFVDEQGLVDDDGREKPEK